VKPDTERTGKGKRRHEFGKQEISFQEQTLKKKNIFPGQNCA
jgi:hypothetical protein